MDSDLIVAALKKACGNKNFRFQAIVHKSQLHIYINRKADYVPDYILLADTIGDAIASLSLDSLEGIWLYSRKLGEIDPDWQFFLESPQAIDEEAMDTQGDLGNKQLEDFGEFEDFPEEVDNSLEDTGLLKDTGFIHTKPLSEAEINPFIENDKIEGEAETNPSIEDDKIEVQAETNPFIEEDKVEAQVKVDPITENSKTETPAKTGNLAEYCFVNRKILTGSIIPPEKKIIRLVKFFHHLSWKQQQPILLGMPDFFKQGTTPESETFSPAVKKWLKQISELQAEDRNTLAIWLSRYCFDPVVTIAEFKIIEENKATKKKIRRSNVEYDFTPANSKTSSPSELEDISEPKFKLHPVVEKSIIPIVWTLATLVFICLGIYTDRGNLRSTSQDIPAICKTSIGSPNYCRLGVNLAGEQAIARASDNIFPLSAVTETVANYGCERFANVKAEAFSNLDPTKNLVIESRGEKIFPHIYVVEALQKKADLSGNVRVGCVYTTGQGERSPQKLASEVIPVNWPQEHYQANHSSESNLSFGIYTNLINLGLYTLFSAVALGTVAEFKLGIAISNRPQTIYVVALGLGLIQSLALVLPIFNLTASLLFSVATILIYDRLVKNFQLNWHNGNAIVASGILTILAIQFILYGIFLNLISLVVNI